MKEKRIKRILVVATVAISLPSMIACGTFPQKSQLSAFLTDCSGSGCFAANSEAHVPLLSANTLNMRSVNDYLAQCDEQARLIHHEIQNCRAVTVLTVPLDHADTAILPHTPGRGLS